MSGQSNNHLGTPASADQHSADNQSTAELEQLTRLWQQAPIDAEALLRSVKARSASQRIRHYVDICLCVLALALLIRAMQEPLNAAMWVFVVVSVPSIIWLQWLSTQTRLSARYLQAHDAQSLLALAMKQCRAEIRLAHLTQNCCYFVALFGAVWLPWLAVSSWPLVGHDRFFVPFSIFWWISWLTLMYAWAKRKQQREMERLKELEHRAQLD
jgi:hypothetical protein